MYLVQRGVIAVEVEIPLLREIDDVRDLSLLDKDDLIAGLFDDFQVVRREEHRVLTHELCNEYVNFQVFSDGEWSYR